MSVITWYDSAVRMFVHRYGGNMEVASAAERIAIKRGTTISTVILELAARSLGIY